MRSFVVACWLAVFTGGCTPQRTEPAPADSSAPPAPPPATAPAGAEKQPVAEALTPAQVYAARCASCHGATGRGDGKGAQFLPSPPRSFAEEGWQRSAKDAHLRRVIVEGGKAVGLSESMPAAKDLASEPATVDGLVELIRGFGARP